MLTKPSTCSQRALNRLSRREVSLSSYFTHRSATLTTTILIFFDKTSLGCVLPASSEKECALCVILFLCSRLYLNMRISTVVNQMLCSGFRWRCFAWRGLVIKHRERGEQLNRLNLSPKARIPKWPKWLCGYSKMRAIMFQPAV